MYGADTRTSATGGNEGQHGQSQIDADHAMAMQMQRQELERMGGDPQGMNQPLISLGNSNRDGSSDDARQTRINALQNVREVRSASFTLCLVLLVNVPQIIAAVCILGRYWNDHTCNETETLKWRTYALIAALRMFFYVSARFLSHARNGLDAFGLIWFVVGNMWLFGGDVEVCPHPNRSPLYTLCVAMVFINYAQLCLPCIVVIIMLPILCFCLPCLIRVLARIQDPMRGKGATPSMINKLPTMKYREVLQLPAVAQAAVQEGPSSTSEPTTSTALSRVRSSSQSSTAGPHGESNSTSCAICISEYTPDDDCRLLPCHHYFHNGCVDEWLRVNASCPTCRASISESEVSPGAGYGTTSPPHRSQPPEQLV